MYRTKQGNYWKQQARQTAERKTAKSSIFAESVSQRSKARKTNNAPGHAMPARVASGYFKERLKMNIEICSTCIFNTQGHCDVYDKPVEEVTEDCDPRYFPENY